MKTQHKRQYLYLVCRTYDECTQPVKSFLKKHEAITFGRRLASKEEDCNISYELYCQEITRAEQFEFVKTLEPYSNVAFSKLAPMGSDSDIDTRRA